MPRHISMKRIKTIARETKNLPNGLRVYVMPDGSTAEEPRGFVGFTNSDGDVRWLTYFEVPATVEEVANAIRMSEHYQRRVFIL